MQEEVPNEQLNNNIPTNPPKDTKSKKPLLITLALFLVLSIIAYVLVNKKGAEPNNSGQNSTQQSEAKNPVLFYATKNGKTSKVFALDTTNGTTSEEVSFEETYEYREYEGNYWDSSKPDADLSPDGMELVYSADSNIVLRDINTDAEETIVKSTLKNPPTEVAPIEKVEPSPPETDGPGPSSLGDPVWSRDGKEIGFRIGHYEGSSYAVINRSAKTYTNLGNTFRYVNEEGLPDRLTILEESKPLLGMGIFAELLVKEYASLTGPTITLDNKRLLAILCPKNLPDSGHYQYLESAYKGAELENLRRQRDCGEEGSLTLISIDPQTGSYQQTGEGKFGHTVAVQENNDVIVSGSAAKDFDLLRIHLSGGDSEAIKISDVGEMKPGETIKAVILKNAGKTPIAEIYFEIDGKRAVKIVDLSEEKVVATIDLAANTVFNTVALIK